MGKSAIGDVLVIGGIGVGAWLAWPWISSLFGSPAATPSPVGGVIPPANVPVSSIPPTNQIAPITTPITAPSGTGTPPPAPTSCGGLTVADAATFPYSNSIIASCIQNLNPQLSTNLGAGQISQIAGNSVLAFMLGWGGATAGQTQTVLGDTYTFDGTNWNLKATGMSGWRGMGARRTMTRTNRGNYVRMGAPYRRLA